MENLRNGAGAHLAVIEVQYLGQKLGRESGPLPEFRVVWENHPFLRNSGSREELPEAASWLISPSLSLIYTDTDECIGTFTSFSLFSFRQEHFSSIILSVAVTTAVPD